MRQLGTYGGIVEVRRIALDLAVGEGDESHGVWPFNWYGDRVHHAASCAAVGAAGRFPYFYMATIRATIAITTDHIAHRAELYAASAEALADSTVETVQASSFSYNQRHLSLLR